MFEGIGSDNRTSRRYFSAALIVFLASFVLMASSKWTNNIFYAFIALPGLVFLVKERGAGLFSDKLGLAWLVFLLWFLVPAAIAGEGQFYKHIVYVTLFVFVVAGLVNHDFMRSWVFARALFWIICLYIFAYALYAYATGLYALGQRVDLLPARMENVIYVSIWLLCALALAMPHWLRRQHWVEAFAAVALSLVAVSFVLQTRTAMLGAAFLFAAWAIWALWRFPRVAGPWLLGFAVLGAVVLWLIKDAGWVHSVIARGDSFRGELFRVMVGEWQNCGWALGCGVEFHTDKLLSGTMPIQHPHNIFVALGLYTGGVSLLLFLVIVVMTLVQAVRLRDPWGMYLACALVMLNFDGSKLIGNPDELWPLVLLPAAMVLGRGLQQRRLR
ncbi:MULTISPECIES: O-antigen ligase domain-containing protein [unclassified Pseudomonas]|uniref:O-antigen ligase domain-containing protein n=1 Tax=unclassified Pseudomonas TaxID=196821 RepID=UPI0018E68625|nr:O-antigen ligase domain-containing protein [Pseudomonas sp. CCOS 191]MBI6953503.1 O-antigen ligase domain-containing protein [Pseudomonas sp. CCOS 191]